MVVSKPPLEPPVSADITRAAIKTEKLAMKLTHQLMTRLNFGAISNSEERLAGRAFLTFGFFSFLGFAAFAATGTASATLAALTAFATAFLGAFVSFDSTLSSSPI